MGAFVSGNNIEIIPNSFVSDVMRHEETLTQVEVSEYRHPSNPSHPLQYRAYNVSETDTRSDGTLKEKRV